MCVLPVCMSVYVICSSTCTGQKMASYPVGLELQMVMSHDVDTGN